MFRKYLSLSGCGGRLFKTNNQKGIQNKFLVDSAGTIGNHQGEFPDPRTQKSALKKGITLTSFSRILKPEDLINFDYILCMYKSNVENVKKLDPNNLYENKIKLFTDFRIKQNFTEVPDPYWGNESDFDTVTDIVIDASQGFLASIL